MRCSHERAWEQVKIWQVYSSFKDLLFFEQTSLTTPYIIKGTAIKIYEISIKSLNSEDEVIWANFIIYLIGDSVVNIAISATIVIVININFHPVLHFMRYFSAINGDINTNSNNRPKSAIKPCNCISLVLEW